MMEKKMKRILFMLGMLALVSTKNANKIIALDDKPYCESSDTDNDECDNELSEPDEMTDLEDVNTPVCMGLEKDCPYICWD